MTFIVPTSGLLKTVINFAIGFGVPLILTCISFGVTFDYYGTSGCQWVDSAATRES